MRKMMKMLRISRTVVCAWSMAMKIRRAILRCTMRECGAGFVMMSGMNMMLKWRADSWATLGLWVSPTVDDMATLPTPSGWTMCTATALRRGWRIVGLRAGEFMIVTEQRQLE